MSNPATLIHLVSEQTLQNLFPTLALQPARVLQIRSADPRFEDAPDRLAKAARLLQQNPVYGHFQPDFQPPVVLDSPSPGVAETRKAVAECLCRFPDAVVNYTGGTKLMSIGAWEAAVAAGVPTPYCDTRERRFVLDPPTAFPALPRFDQLAATLTVGAVMAAHGTQRHAWDSEPVNDDLLRFGQTAWRIWSSAYDVLVQYASKLREHFRRKNNRLPQSRKDLDALAAAPLPAPGSDPGAAQVTAYLDAAVAAGLLRRGAAERDYLPACPPERRELERLSNLLDGSWLELYLAGLLLKTPDRYADVHWSVRPRDQRQSAFGETDVICVDLAATALHIFSCKRAVSRPLEHLEALSQRRRDLGGGLAQATLCIFRPSGDGEQLQRWGRLLDIEVLPGERIAERLSPKS